MTADRLRADVAASVQYVTQYCSPGDRVLEVGSGDGSLAEALNHDGYPILALEHSPEAVEAIRRRGVDVVESDFLDFEGDEFDVVLFSRSLHHIHPIEQAVGKAAMLLRPDGRLIVDDFDFTAMDVPSADWFYELASQLASAGVVSDYPERKPEDALSFWLADHSHEPALATREKMSAELSRLFRVQHQEDCPYLFRYFLNSFTDPEAAPNILASILAWESGLIAEGRLQSIGWRSVWTIPVRETA